MFAKGFIWMLTEPYSPATATTEEPNVVYRTAF